MPCFFVCAHDLRNFAMLVVQVPNHDPPGDDRQKAGNRAFAPILFQKPVMVMPESGKHHLTDGFPLGD